jgi:hypothetical protein
MQGERRSRRSRENQRRGLAFLSQREIIYP